MRGIFASNVRKLSGSRYKVVVSGKATQPVQSDLPKWMRFFLPAGELEIDLDRSLTNIKVGEADFFAQSFITTHNKDFALYQLIRSLKIITAQWSVSKLVQEIRIRIVTRDWFVEEMDFEIISQTLDDYFRFDPLLREFVLHKIVELFAVMPLSTKFKAIAFQIRTNQQSQVTLRQFFALLKELDAARPADESGKSSDCSKLEALMRAFDINTQFSALYALNNLSIFVADPEMNALFQRLLERQTQRVDSLHTGRQPHGRQVPAARQHIGHQILRGVFPEPVDRHADGPEQAAVDIEVFVAFG